MIEQDADLRFVTLTLLRGHENSQFNRIFPEGSNSMSLLEFINSCIKEDLLDLALETLEQEVGNCASRIYLLSQLLIDAEQIVENLEQGKVKKSEIKDKVKEVENLMSDYQLRFYAEKRFARAVEKIVIQIIEKDKKALQQFTTFVKPESRQFVRNIGATARKLAEYLATNGDGNDIKYGEVYYRLLVFDGRI